MIINIRGTSGSGKTTLVMKFFDMCTSVEPIQPEDARRPKGYKCDYKGETVFVVGSYETACGGCDTISTQDEIQQLIQDFALEGHVLFEGLFISHIYGRYAEMAREEPDNFVFIMLETPFDTCMEHIRERRRETGRCDELAESVYRNAGNTYRSTYRIRDKLTDEGLMWEELPLENRFELFENMLDMYLLGL